MHLLLKRIVNVSCVFDMDCRKSVNKLKLDFEKATSYVQG